MKNIASQLINFAVETENRRFAMWENWKIFTLRSWQIQQL
jgi:hypothetical protein